MKTIYDIYLIFSHSCLQCDYVLEKLKSYNLIKDIKLVDSDDKDNQQYLEELKISQVPSVIIMRHNKILDKRILNKPEDIDWLISGWFV